MWPVSNINYEVGIKREWVHDNASIKIVMVQANFVPYFPPPQALIYTVLTLCPFYVSMYVSNMANKNIEKVD